MWEILKKYNLGGSILIIFTIQILRELKSKKINYKGNNMIIYSVIIIYILLIYLPTSNDK